MQEVLYDVLYEVILCYRALVEAVIAIFFVHSFQPLFENLLMVSIDLQGFAQMLHVRLVFYQIKISDA